MVIKKETVNVTTEIEFEGEFYVRQETPVGIYWSKQTLVGMSGKALFEYSNDRWQRNVKCCWHDYQEPEIETQYQRLKASL